MDNSKLQIKITLDQVQSYMNHSPIGYILIDMKGKIITINQLLLKSSNYTEMELINENYKKFFVFEGSDEDFFEKLNSFNPSNLYTLSWKDKEATIHYSKVTIWKFNTEPIIYAIGFMGIKRDKGSSLLSKFAESFVLANDIGFILINKELLISEISPLAAKLLNVTINSVINRNIDEIFAGVPEEHRIVQKALLDGIIVTNHAVTWTISNRRYDLLIDSNIIRDENGSIVGAYVVFKDVTNLRSLEQQVQQNDRLKTIGQIAAGTAHEIRNPLTSIKGFLQVLNNTLIENGLTSELKYTEIMLSEIERINKLVNEILLLSKPKDIVYRPTDINKALKEIVPIISNESLLYGTEVSVDLDKSIPLVIADSELLKQVFLNIAKNGLEAMSGGGKLDIITRINDSNRTVEILFHDTGPGIPSYIADKIFEPFFTTKESGTGLGLSICQKIIHDLGGSIRISSKGFGTTFFINIPYI